MTRRWPDGGFTLAVSGLLVLVLGGLGLWAGSDAGHQAEAAHRADRVAHQVTLGNLTGQSSQVAAAEITDILAADRRAGARAWSGRANDPVDEARLRASAEGSRALSAGAILLGPGGTLLATYQPRGALPPADDPGWAPLRSAVLSGDGSVPVSGVLHAGNLPVVAVAVPTGLADGSIGRLVGLADLRASALARYVRRLVNPDGRKGYVLDSRGLVIAGPDESELGEPMRYAHVRAAVIRGGSGIVDVREGDTTFVTSHAPAGDTGWSAVTLQDRKLFLGPLQRAARRAQAALVLLLLFAGSSMVVLHRRREAVLREVALRDEMTGALNRRGWYEAAEGELAKGVREGLHRGLLFVDLDGLKDINDSLGHGEGDRAIAATAQLLRFCSTPGDLLGRLGGDEFVLLLIDGPPTEVVTGRIRDALHTYNAGSGASFELRLSTGAAAWQPHEPCELDELVRRADADMYADKLTRPQRHVGLLRIPAQGRPAVPAP